ncbi:MAG TPA: hypothetical protein VGQ04_00295 [Chitinophagaceae bacterium]|jgi:hypothetical protein|nr:hypothetical protein [Chitinophagaceae bacterium]
MELRLDPELPLEYFSLQLEYAKRAAQISKISLDQALMEFTSFWRRIHDLRLLETNKTEWSFDSKTPQWQELCDRINNNELADIVAHDLYLRNDNSTEAGKQYFGCFRYDFISQVDDDDKIIKIHFKNRDNSGEGPLSKERQSARLQDLKRMFEFIGENHPEATVVMGGSWLYNLKSYQRLFPKAFISNMKVEEIPFPRTSGIWGQFLNSNGQVNEKIKCSFLNKADHANSTEELLDCFEFKILFARTIIKNFYSHLAIV